jgi:hypothetical protein
MNLRHRGVSALPRGTVVTQHTLHATVEVIRAGYPTDPVCPGPMAEERAPRAARPGFMGSLYLMMGRSNRTSLLGSIHDFLSVALIDSSRRRSSLTTACQSGGVT